jgi:hypothetical protein
VEVGSEERDWGELPTGGVIWVDVINGGYRHRLQGHDNYWVHGNSFGVFNDPENWEWYGGKEQFFKWRWTGRGSEVVIPAHVPRKAHVLKGVTVSDEVAWELGLLRVGERLPPRGV